MRKTTATNDIPQSEWPIRKGTLVWCLSTRLAVGYPKIARGRVWHYNPALVGSMLVTKDSPFYTIKAGMFSSETVDSSRVRVGAKGKRELLEMLAMMHDEAARVSEVSALASRAAAQRYRAEAKGVTT